MAVHLSLTLIVKNEESTLPACLASMAGLVDEILVVDTGSTDRTREVAAGLGARVLDFPWIDDFAAARNEGLKHATGKWIFWLDADERLDDANREKLRALIAGLTDENAGYVMKQRSSEGSGAATVVDQVRLFRNHPQVRWRYRVHEQILPALRQVGCENEKGSGVFSGRQFMKRLPTPFLLGFFHTGAGSSYRGGHELTLLTAI